MTALRKWIAARRMEVVAPAIQAVRNYKEALQTDDQVHVQGYRLLPPFKRVLEPNDFQDELAAVLVGAEAKGRKGHASIGYAYICLQREFISKNPDRYRKPRLRFVGFDQSTYGATKLCEQLEHDLGKQFETQAGLPHQECLDFILRSNLSLCASAMECLPNSIFEGMFAGHALIRNACSGLDEQLIPNENGYLFDSNSFESLIDALERIHNREKTSNEKLAAMSAKSVELASRQEQNSFQPLVQRIKKHFNPTHVPF
jgi:glycosyltransferase involved in cell wall biosynthesis